MNIPVTMRACRCKRVAARSYARLFPRGHPLDAGPALPSSHKPAAPCRAGVDDPEVLTAAMAAFEPALVLRGVPSLSLGHRFGHDSLLRRSSCVYRFRWRTGAALASSRRRLVISRCVARLGCLVPFSRGNGSCQIAVHRRRCGLSRYGTFPCDCFDAMLCSSSTG